MKRNTFILALALLTCCLFWYCQGEKSVTKKSESPYLNLHDTIKYVGIETCRKCHENVYQTFIKTGMGESFGLATPQKSKATFDQHFAIYDSISDYYYRPHWKGDSLFIDEFRLANKDTVHKHSQYVKYIIGSGQHTNSHIFEENGSLFQAPITFYTQKKIWDLAPGFDGGFNSRFNRIIGLECMSCHNALPKFMEGSENKYISVPHGINCERCHGPGEAHVLAKESGDIIDTSKYIDYSIVNPADLSRDLQMNVCQRCHLQGVAILKDGKNFDDFRPAMPLTDVMDVFLPEYDGNETQFIMASQAHRLAKSKCYKASEMTCLSCHNPHISVKFTPKEQFNNACLKCHNSEKSNATDTISFCTMPEKERITANKNDCSTCHLPESGSIDIPHVTIHDHYIRKPISEEEKQKVEHFIGLTNATNGDIDALTQAKAYLHYYESYASKAENLDSAAFYLKKSDAGFIHTFATEIHLNYLKDNYQRIIEIAKKAKIYMVKDAWTAYRIGESYLQTNEYQKASDYLAKAVDLLPLQVDFRNKYGISLMKQSKIEEAKDVFSEIVAENKNHISALTNLGFCFVNLGLLSEAEKNYQAALKISPDYEMALLNSAALYLLQRNTKDAKKMLERLLKVNPKHEQAKAMKQRLMF